ncbi:AAA family ATPase [Pseudanabaena yagii]|uniref:AAA family ATPase n=1 Tax=Pseudanabaena yagii GIHE-NHR1 TaxID=2722753 RepID=A0ABX1LVX1_9CYAN|nr:ATP-binding protein [Pseudanabaena yagii]NMF60322.1 AAA family ATPase [Pseudanabaena yagii GIHE-NHR1]
MKLKRVIIKGLNNKVDCNRYFHDDINIVTGINGCGKTTLLKILWYAISANIERLISDISFESFYLETSHFCLSLFNDDGIQWQHIANGVKQNGFINLGEYNSADEIGVLKSLIIKDRTSSLFFPTFRRIEGAYLKTIANIRSMGMTERMLSGILDKPIDAFSIKIQDDFEKLSDTLTSLEHKFICSVSTHDLGYLLHLHDDKITKKIEECSRALNKSLISKLENIKSGIEESKDESLAIVSKLQREVADVNNKRDELLQPFKVLSELVTKVMHYKGVKLDDFTIGQSDDAIDSRLLSSGEQQMLSFLCYNAFYENSVIFIDEPELSLHPDWQRRLFPNLMKQQSSNQFIVATHSPFIYSKYEDKEIILSEEKGE